MTIGGIIVAAGSSTRMGGSDKLLLQVGDRPRSAAVMAGKLAITPESAPPMRMPMPRGRSISP
jgi:CTP:molybdopterin cytidylyltransferase MocA